MSNVIKAHNVVQIQPVRETQSVPQDASQPEEDTQPDAHAPEPALIARTMLNEAPLEHVARAKVDTMLDTAREDAQLIVEKAEEQRASLIDQAKREGYADGFAEGQAVGEEQGRAAFQKQAEVVGQVLEEIHHVQERLIERHYEDIIELAVALSAKLTRRAGGLDAETAKQLLEEMLPRATGSRQVIVKLSRGDMAELEHDLEQLSSFADASSEVRFVTDERLATGDVIVETDKGNLVGTRSVRSRRLAEQLLDVIEHEH